VQHCAPRDISAPAPATQPNAGQAKATAAAGEGDAHRNVSGIQTNVEPQKAIKLRHTIVVSQREAASPDDGQQCIDRAPRSGLNGEMAQHVGITSTPSHNKPAPEPGCDTRQAPQEQPCKMRAFVQ
jgi:hypothetical protein